MLESSAMLHITQKNILDLLARADSCRYGEIKPDDIDGNVFGYHLKQTISGGLVEKDDDGFYRLTEKGRRYIITRYEDPLEAAHSILLLVVRSGEYYLVRERKIQPMLGTIGFVHGEPKFRQPVTESASLRLLDKTGIQAQLSVVSSGIISITRESKLESYSHAIILLGEVDSAELPIGEDSTGRNRWIHKDEFNNPKIIPSCRDILNIIEQQQSWFELDYSL